MPTMKRSSSKPDSIRQRVLELVADRETNLAAVSRAIGRNHAYLHQFVHRGKPHRLPEIVRHALAQHFGIDEAELVDPSDRIAGLGIGSRPERRSAAEHLNSFAARLSVARAGSGHGVPTRFAEAAGIDIRRYAELEEGEDDPTLDELDRISKASGMSLDWLIRGDLDNQDEKTQPGGLKHPTVRTTSH